MIYFIQEQQSGHIKIGYAKDTKKRRAGLQSASPHTLVLLGSVPGGLDEERAFHAKFAKHKLQGEWFRGTILHEVLAIIAKEKANPSPQNMNVIVAGDSELHFVWSSDDQNKHQAKLEALVYSSLDEIHAKTQIAYVIIGGSRRQIEYFARLWANKNKVKLCVYEPNYAKYGRSAVFKVGPQMLKSMFDTKTLLVIHSEKASPNTQKLIRGANKAKIPIVAKLFPALVLATSKPPPALVEDGKADEPSALANLPNGPVPELGKG